MVHLAYRKTDSMSVYMCIIESRKGLVICYIRTSFLVVCLVNF